MEIWARCQEVLDEAMEKAGAGRDDIAALGITNQRETTVVWDRNTGEPVMNAIVWQDTRTDKLVDELSADGGQDRFRTKVGLPLATYFSGPKVRWILDNVDGARARAEAGDLVFGNIDTWCIWNLTGGTNGGLHITDVTNASRTMLMNLATLDWDDEHLRRSSACRCRCCRRSGPRARSTARSPPAGLTGVQVAGDLGDQQAATFGQACFSPGEAKNTYGTGNFMLLNTGTEAVQSKSGLLTTVGYKVGDNPAVYCLEGSIAITGALVQWLRDNLKMIKAAPEVEDAGQDGRGQRRPVHRAGVQRSVRALLEVERSRRVRRPDAVCERGTRRPGRAGGNRVADPRGRWTRWRPTRASRSNALKVDGGMVANDLLMQIQADVLGVPVIRPEVAETTALGASYAAGMAVGFWSTEQEVRDNWAEDKRWEPKMDEGEREEHYKFWKKAVSRTFDWVE